VLIDDTSFVTRWNSSQIGDCWNIIKIAFVLVLNCNPSVKYIHLVCHTGKVVDSLYSMKLFSYSEDYRLAPMVFPRKCFPRKIPCLMSDLYLYYLLTFVYQE
jgi:hypothetical protein